MTEDKKISKTFTKLPTLSPSTTADPLFADDKISNFMSKKNSLATTQGFLSRRTTTELKVKEKLADISGRMPSPENFLTMSKTITEEFDVQSARHFVVSPHARSSDSTAAHALKKKLSSEHNVNDFYLRSLGQTKYTSNVTNSTQNKFYIPSSRHTHQSFYETGQTNKAFTETKKSGMSDTITQELALLAAGKSPKRRFVDELNATIKHHYRDKKDFQKAFEDVDVANYCLEEVVDRLKCYRSEMGNILEKIQGLYKKIFKKFLDLSMKSEKQIEDSAKTNEKETGNAFERLNRDITHLKTKIDEYRRLLDAEETKAKIQQFNIESLNSEIHILYDMIKKDSIVDMNREEEEAAERSKKMMYLKHAAELEERLLLFQHSISNFEQEQAKKEADIENMNFWVKKMLVNESLEKGVQVNEIELMTTVREVHQFDRPNITSEDVNTNSSTAINVQSVLIGSLPQIDKIQGVDTVEVQSLKDVPIKDFSLTTDRLLTESHTGQKMTMADMKNLVQGIAEHWNLPMNISIFLENVSKSRDSAGVLPWNFFKKIIFDVYIDRLSLATEMQNSLISTFIPTSEYLCIYFLRKFELRRTAELKLLEFLASLRYYSAHWQRALTFANMANICNLKFSATNQGMYTPMEKCDAYIQHYFYYCFSKVIADASLLFDTPEALTYYPKTKIEPLIEDCLFFLTEEQRKAFFNNNKKHIRFYTETEEGFDIDKLLHMFCEEYMEAKSKNITKISKSLTPFFNDDKGETVLSLDEIFSLIKQVLNNDVSPIPGYMYPSSLHIARSYLFSLTSGKNSYSLTVNNILASITRFGIDSPFPYINISKMPAGLTATSMTAIPEDMALFSPSRISNPMRKPATNNKLPARYSINSNTPVNNQGSGKSPKKFGDESVESGMLHVEPSADGRRRTALKVMSTGQDGNKGMNIDGASMMFTQHFSILREMKNQIHQLNKLVKIEQERDVLMKHFEQVAHALDSACQFLSFPISY